MDLDITFDARSTLGVPTDPYATQNAHVAAFDLDTIYGLGPFVTPQYYEKDDPLKLRIESGGVFEDLPRNADLMPIIPDPRTDQHLMISGLHCAFILFHNRTVDYVRQTSGLTDPPAIFAEAKRLVTWHYHWLILSEFLPLFVGPAMTDEVLSRGRRYYKPDLGLATMPVEFQGACFRLGHTMVRPSYRANLKGDGGKPFFGLIFDPALGDVAPAPGVDPGDLRGGFRAPRLVPDTDIGKNAGGFHLGPVGGRIVAEVVIGLLDSDPNSYLVQQPGWTPTLQRPGPSFRMTDFLTFAGVDPATRRTKRPDLA